MQSAISLVSNALKRARAMTENSGKAGEPDYVIWSERGAMAPYGTIPEELDEVCSLLFCLDGRLLSGPIGKDQIGFYDVRTSGDGAEADILAGKIKPILTSSRDAAEPDALISAARMVGVELLSRRTEVPYGPDFYIVSSTTAGLDAGDQEVTDFNSANGIESEDEE